MSNRELRHLLGSIVTVVTAAGGSVHGTLLSCTTQSLWLVDDGEDDVVVPIEDVRSVCRDAA